MHATAIRRISLSLCLALLSGCPDDNSTSATEPATNGSTATNDPVTVSGTMSAGDTVEPVPTSTAPTSSDTTSTSTASSETSVLPTTTEAAAGCDDGAQNGGETDVDCGGPCPACAPGQACVEHEDCATQWCVDGVCGEPECEVDGDCPAPGPCQTAWCDPVARTCEEQPEDDGMPCDDGMLCTAPGERSAGACQAGEGLPVLSLAAIPPGAGFVIDGLEAGHQFGLNLAGLGDINGDGREDLIVTGEQNFVYEGGGYNPYFVIFGKDDDAPVELADVEAGIGGFMIHPEPGDITGRMARAGDVNGDGLDDLVVAWSFGQDLEGVNAAAGRVYVVFGKQDTEHVRLEDVFAGVGGFAIVGEQEGGSLGLAIGDAGDVDGDGLADVIMSQPFLPSPSGGRVWVVFGGAAQSPRETSQIGSGGFMISSSFPDGSFGFSDLRTIGDLDSDGHDDVLIGSAGMDIPEVSSGQGHVVFGKADSATVMLDDVQAGVGGFAITGVGKYGNLGSEVDGLGDVNDDGLPDFAISAPHRYNEAVGPGRIYIVHGQPNSSGVDVDELEQGIGGSVIYAENDDDHFGHHMAVVGDQNGDGRADILARLHNLFVEPDRAYVLFTPADTTPTTIDALVDGGGGFVIDAVPDTILLRTGGADVNGDGFGDLLLTAYGADENGEDSGRVYVLFGPTCAP